MSNLDVDDLDELVGAAPATDQVLYNLGRRGPAPDVAAIPKTATPARVAENRGALDVRLTDDDHATLDAAFPPPDRKRPLEIL